MTSKSSMSDFKRLGFVRDYSSFYWTKSGEIASNVYSTSKQYAPKSLLPRINAVEDTVSQYSHPAFAQLQDRSDGVLRSLDSSVSTSRQSPIPGHTGQSPDPTVIHEPRSVQVDYAVKTAGSYYSGASDNVSSVHKDNMQRYNSSRDAYFSKVQEAVEYVKAHGVSGSARGAADSLLAQVEGAKHIPATLEKQAHFATEKVKEAWTNFQGLPIGASFLLHRWWLHCTRQPAWQISCLSHPILNCRIQAQA